MTFQRVSPNGHYRSLRLRSEGGRWELGLSPYHHGMRLRMGACGHPPRVMDVCLGRDASLFLEVLLAVLRRLEPFEEHCTPEAVDAAFPWAGTRPDLAVHLPELLGKPPSGCQPVIGSATGRGRDPDTSRSSGTVERNRRLRS